MQHPVDAAERIPDSGGESGVVVGARGVELQHRRRARQPPRRTFGEAAGTPEAGEHDLGPVALRAFGDGEGDALARNHTCDHEPLARQQPRCRVGSALGCLFVHAAASMQTTAL
ncbi:hypothetical protein HRbin41_00578 [bacterium HR41]|nr:hypothetical protein HRbin41_00578 [bacterium HR41]